MIPCFIMNNRKYFKSIPCSINISCQKYAIFVHTYCIIVQWSDPPPERISSVGVFFRFYQRIEKPPPRNLLEKSLRQWVISVLAIFQRLCGQWSPDRLRSESARTLQSSCGLLWMSTGFREPCKKSTADLLLSQSPRGFHKLFSAESVRNPREYKTPWRSLFCGVRGLLRTSTRIIKV